MKLIKNLGTIISLTGKKQSWAKFLCPICLQIVERQLSNGKKQKSCGSLNCKENKGSFKHGERHTKLYGVWYNMKTRVLNPNIKQFKDWGGRGIIICDEWLKFTPFRDWSLSNGYQEGLIIDRKNPDGNYEPNNCRFITVLESNRNKTNTITLEQANEIRELYKTGKYTQRRLAEIYDVTKQTISLIINNKQWKN